MSIAIPSRIVVSGTLGPTVCPITIARNRLQITEIDLMSCCIQSIDLCIAQGASKVFQMRDAQVEDFSSATEITFDVWEAFDGTLLLSKTLTGGDIILPSPNIFQFSVTEAESGAISAGRKYCEAWVIIAGGDRQIVGEGSFRVQDTRKFD